MNAQRTARRSRLALASPWLLGWLGSAFIPATALIAAEDRVAEARAAQAPVADARVADARAPGVRFVRGDVDGDGRTTISDSVAMLELLFGTQGPAPCLDAADANADGAIDTSDALRLLAFLFSGGAPPPAPYPACGTDGTGEGLGCDRHAACAEEAAGDRPLAELPPPRQGGEEEAGTPPPMTLAAEDPEETEDRTRSGLHSRESRALPALRGGGGGALGRRISLGEVIAGEISSYRQVDAYTFGASRGGRIAVDRLSASNAGGLNWTVEDVWGRVVASDLTALNDLAPVAVLGGDYTLRVLPEGSGTGTYSFRVVDASDAPEIRISLGETIAGAIDPDHPGERDRYAFSAPPGGRVFLDLISTAAAGLRWRLEDAFARQVVASRALADFGPVALVGGDYRLTIEGPLAGGSLATGAYEFRIVGLDDPVETPIVLGEAVAGEIALPGGFHVYTLDVPPGQLVFLDAIASSNAAVLNWEILDRVGRAVLARTTSLGDLGPMALAGGEYRIRILGEGGGTATYEVRVTDANPSPPRAISLGEEVSGEVAADRPGVAQAHELSVPVGTQVTLELIQSSNTAGLDWELLDAYGRSVLGRTTSLATTGPIPLVGGAYRLLVVPEGASTGTYRFRVRDDGTVASSPSGTPVGVGDDVSAAVTAPGGEVRYTLAAAAGERVYIDLLEAHADLDWELLDPVGRSLGLRRANSTDSSDLGPYALAAGTYTLALRARTATATPGYRFRISSAPVIVGDATIDELISGDFGGAAGSTRRFRIPVGEGQEVFLDRLIASPRLEWSLLDPAGREVFPLRRADGVDDDEGPFVLAAGTYTLLLDPQFGYEPPYEIVVRSVEHTTSSIEIGETVLGSFAAKAGSVARFTFEAGDGERLYFDRVTAQSAFRLQWALLDPVGERIFGLERADLVDADRGPYDLAAGTYTLLFDPQAGSEPTYDFRVLRVEDTVGPLIFGATTSGVLGPGATATYDLDATDGRRVLFDLVTTSPFLRWSLIDELGEAVARDVNASTPAVDLGPYVLREGRYRLVVDATNSSTHSYGFAPIDVTVDLVIDDLFADERVFFASDSRREITLTWWARNAGGGPEPAAPATDRVVLSTDGVFGNADDIALGDFVRFEPVAPHGAYARTATVEVPASIPAGTYRLLVALDADDLLEEPGGESNNVGVLEIRIVEDLPPAEPELVETTSFPVAFAARGTESSLDVPLSRAVSLDSIRYVHVEAASLALSGPRNDTLSNVSLLLLSGRDEVLEVSTVSPSAGAGTGSFVARFSRRLEPQTVALLPKRLVDGIRLRVDQPSTTSTTIGSIHSDGRLRLIFAGCEFAPCGPHLERRSPGAEGLTFQGTGQSEWVTVLFDEPVGGDGLRFVSGPRFAATVTHGLGIAAAHSEAQLIVDDGTLLTLNDSRAPSSLGAPGFATISADHALALEPSALSGRQVLGFQWRISATFAGLGGVTSFYEPRDELAVRFLYEVASCTGSMAIPPVELSPGDGAAFSPGSFVTLSGRALAPQAGRPVSAVLVDGEPVDSIDAAGRFFKKVRIEEGQNLFVVGVVEPGCGEYETILRLFGLPDGTNGLDGYEEAGAQLRVEYADTTFRRGTDDLVVRSRVRNVSRHPVRGPILMALSNLRPGTVEALAAAGLTERGEPFVVLLEGGVLPPAEAGPWVSLPFRTRERARVEFDPRWLVPANRPPHFETVPPSRAVAGARYEYLAAAADLDGDAPTFRLDHGPPGMALAAGGALAWTPGPGDVGTHAVSLTAEDGVGGEATQRWTVTVVAAAANRPPYFTTAPELGAAVGGLYAYDAEAADPDGDPVAYLLIEGPEGLSLEASSGRLRWAYALPGAHAVSLEARDGAGASAVQAFVLSVGTAPSNPSAPRITTSPATEAAAGILFVYQPVASDPDGDPPAWSLPVGPEGMAVDATRGRIEWTPRLDQVGSHPVTLRVTDGRGGETRQSFAILVASATANLPPVVETVPPTYAVAGAPYRYDADAVDPEGEAVAFSLAGAPAGMSIDGGTGLVLWTPTAGDAGTRVLTVRATDARGGVGSQAFEIRVRASNAPPAIVSGAPPARVLAGATWQHDLDAGDSDGDVLRYELASGPPSLAVQPVTGLVTWRTTPADVGLHAVLVRALDCCGGVAELPFQIEVLPDTEPPSVAIGFDANPAAVGALVRVTVSASDDVAVSSRALTAECAPSGPVEIRLDEIGRGTFASAMTGYCVFTATVSDPSGNVTVATAVLQVGDPDDPLDPHPPVVTVFSPAPGSIITAPVDVVATIADATEPGRPGSGPLSWTVELAPKGSDAFETLAVGTGAPGIGALASLDPTLLPNGAYRVRIVGNDTVQTGGVEYEVSIAGDLKLGDYSVAFVDLVVPLAGLPIVISRRYDSLDASPGDFGAGWRLGLPGEVEDDARESATGNGLVDLLAAEPFHPGTRVWVTLPDGRRVGFTFTPRNAGGLFAYAYFAAFEPDPGVEEALEVVEPAGGFFLFGGNATQVGVPYNPTTYRLETKEGVRYLIHEVEGLLRIEDPNGNAIDVREDGLWSSTGVSVAFERDGEGRIVRIVEPVDPDAPGGAGDAGELRYFYDEATGNLAAFVNQADEEVRYFYEDPAYPHYLTRIEDPLGGVPVRTVFDEDGRIVAQCGPGGDPATLEGCTSYGYDLVARIRTVFDAEGNRRDLTFDERGNVLAERFFIEDGSTLETTYSYDERDRMTRWTLPGGSSWTYAYDERGNILSVSDPTGRSRTYTHDGCDLVETETDPLGASQEFLRDAKCNLLRVTGPLGGKTELGYDDAGRLAEVVEATGDSWRFAHDPRGNPSAATNPLGETSTSTIDATGDLVTVVDRGGRRIDFLYDAAHRVVSETWDTTPPRTTSYEYNAAGQLVRMVDPDSALAMEYHPSGLLASVDNAGTPGAPRVLIELEYDGNGRLAGVRDSLGGLTAYEYDAMGRLVSARQSGAGIEEKRVDLAYDRDSRVTDVLRYRGPGATDLVARTNAFYDTPGDPRRLSGLLHLDSAGEELAFLEIRRDPAGNVIEMTDAEGVHAYAYDGLGGLLSADHPSGGPQPDETYAYDAVGNRISSHLSATSTLSRDVGLGGHRLLGDDRFDHEYDAAGNRIRRTDRATGETTTFAWDHRNRLTEVARFDGGGTLLGRSTYLYDAANRRIRVSDGATVRHIVHVGHNPALELDSSGGVLVRRFYGPALDAIFAEESAGATRWLLTDQVGSVRDVLAGDGTTLAHYTYDSFGRRVLALGEASATALGFQARPLDPATGLMHFRAREYDPETGRFLSEDALAPHRYAFAFNNPLLYTDPTGRSVAIEYACLATEALLFGLNFAANIALPVAQLYLNIALALETLTPPPGDGGVGAVGNGIVDYISGPLGFLPPADMRGGKVDWGAAGLTAARLALGLGCASSGTSGEAARAQGRAAGSGTGGSWTGPSWTKY